MKILIVCQHYYPEPFRITDIAEKLVKRGHSVTVLCGIPNYPKGQYYDGYSKTKNRQQTINGVRTIRAYELPRKTGLINRFLNYYSFSLSANRIAKKMKEEFDAVLVNELSPILMATPAICYKKKHKHVKVVMYEMDLWPESLLAGGIKKSSLIYNHYKKVSAKIYSQMDEILVSSPAHIEYIQNLIGKSVPIEWLPQYAEDPFPPVNYSRNGPDFNFLFCGNIGKAQSLETVLDAAYLLRNNKHIKFTIVGDGSERKRLMSIAQSKKLDNVIFAGRVPLKDVYSYYCDCDAALVTLTKDSFSGMTIPGKVQSYLKAGLPIISCAGKSTDDIVDKSGCGICAEPENPHSLMSTVIKFSETGTKERLNYSKNAMSYYFSCIHDLAFLKHIESKLHQD